MALGVVHSVMQPTFNQHESHRPEMAWTEHASPPNLDGRMMPTPDSRSVSTIHSIDTVDGGGESHFPANGRFATEYSHTAYSITASGDRMLPGYGGGEYSAALPGNRIPEFGHGGNPPSTVLPRDYFRSYPENVDVSLSAGSGIRSDSGNQRSFNEYDRNGGGNAAVSVRPANRSRTPGPDYMGRRPDLADDDPYYYRRTQELRSKTPTQELHRHQRYVRPAVPPKKPISGTPDFIPASRYQAPPLSPTSRQQPVNGNPDPYSGLPATMPVPPGGNIPGGSRLYANLGPGSNQMRGSSNSAPVLSPLDGPRFGPTSLGHDESNSTRLNPVLKDSWPANTSSAKLKSDGEYFELPVYLIKQDSGFGFRIIGGTEEGSQVNHFVFKLVDHLMFHYYTKQNTNEILFFLLLIKNIFVCYSWV